MLDEVLQFNRILHRAENLLLKRGDLVQVKVGRGSMLKHVEHACFKIAFHLKKINKPGNTQFWSCIFDSEGIYLVYTKSLRVNQGADPQQAFPVQTAYFVGIFSVVCRFCEYNLMMRKCIFPQTKLEAMAKRLGSFDELIRQYTVTVPPKGADDVEEVEPVTQRYDEMYGGIVCSVRVCPPLPPPAPIFHSPPPPTPTHKHTHTLARTHTHHVHHLLKTIRSLSETRSCRTTSVPDGRLPHAAHGKRAAGFCAT